jgi:hypothetical protein
MAKSSQHFYPGSARVSRAGDRDHELRRIQLMNQHNVLFNSANLSLRLARLCTTSQNTAEIE